jgi:ribosomal-protein-serine acetyltransferase
MRFPDPLETRRLLIRVADPDTAPVVNAAIQETYESLHAWLPWADHLPSIDETRRHLVRARSEALQGTDYGLFLWDRATSGFLGAVGLHQRLPDPSRREIGYWLRGSAVGKGYAAEAVAAVAGAAFSALGLAALEIRTSARNLPSQRVALRAGFTLMAVLEDGRTDPDGTPSLTHVYETSPNQ